MIVGNTVGMSGEQLILSQKYIDVAGGYDLRICLSLACSGRFVVNLVDGLRIL